jgi:hypothetical protein
MLIVPPTFMRRIDPIATEDRGQLSNDANQSYYSWGNAIGLGADAADRKFIALIGSRSGGSYCTQMKINGVLGQHIVHASMCSIYVVELPSGGTGSVELWYNQTVNSAGVRLYRAVGMGNAQPSLCGGGAIGGNGNLPLPDGGVAFGISSAYDVMGGYTWTGLNELFETGYGEAVMSLAHKASPSGLISVTCNYQFAAASWGPK